MIDYLPVIIPTFHSPELTSICIRSMEKYRPDWLHLKYVVVENSEDTSYKRDILALADDITWINNPTTLINSWANADAIKVALPHVLGVSWVFLVHNDTCVTNSSFFPSMLSKLEETVLVGTVLDPSRLNAVHVSGYISSMLLLKMTDPFPVMQAGVMIADVGDMPTVKCREEKWPHYCFPNTFNDATLIEKLLEPFKSFHVDRCLDADNNVMWMHLGRGTPKTQGVYNKPNRVYLPGWVEFCERHLNADSV